MNTKRIVLFSAVVVALVVSEYVWFRKDSTKTEESRTNKPGTRETIFDRIVSIPKDLVFDVPQLPPLCDEIVGLTKGSCAHVYF